MPSHYLPISTEKRTKQLHNSPENKRWKSSTAADITQAKIQFWPYVSVTNCTSPYQTLKSLLVRGFIILDPYKYLDLGRNGYVLTAYK